MGLFGSGGCVMLEGALIGKWGKGEIFVGGHQQKIMLGIPFCGGKGNCWVTKCWSGMGDDCCFVGGRWEEVLDWRMFGGINCKND